MAGLPSSSKKIPEKFRPWSKILTKRLKPSTIVETFMTTHPFAAGGGEMFERKRYFDKIALFMGKTVIKLIAGMRRSTC